MRFNKRGWKNNPVKYATLSKRSLRLWNRAVRGTWNLKMVSLSRKKIRGKRRLARRERLMDGHAWYYPIAKAFPVNWEAVEHIQEKFEAQIVQLSYLKVVK